MVTRGTVFKGLLLAGVMLGLVAGRVFYLQRAHYLKAEGFYAGQDWKLALREYDTSLHFYLPFSPYTQRAAGRLWQMGEMFEQEGEPEWALTAYGSLRGSLYSARSFYTPERAWIKRCDEKIAGLNVKLLLEDGSLKPEDAPAEREKHLLVLRPVEEPSVFWSVVALTGFFGWVGSALFTAFRGFEKTGALRKKPALYGALAFVSFLAVWAVALLLA